MLERPEKMLINALSNCLAIAASLCINSNSNIKLTRSTIWSGAVLEISGAKITAVLSSDNVILPRKGRMHSACAGGQCIYYAAHCSGSDTDYKCKLWYSFTPLMPLRQIELSGMRAQVANAEREIRIVRSRVSLIPLASLRFDAPNDSPPT